MSEISKPHSELRERLELCEEQAIQMPYRAPIAVKWYAEDVRSLLEQLEASQAALREIEDMTVEETYRNGWTREMQRIARDALNPAINPHFEHGSEYDGSGLCEPLSNQDRDPASGCPGCGGDRGDNWFDRSLCYCEEGGVMHTRCRKCDSALDFACSEQSLASSREAFHDTRAEDFARRYLRDDEWPDGPEGCPPASSPASVPSIEVIREDASPASEPDACQSWGHQYGECSCFPPESRTP